MTKNPVEAWIPEIDPDQMEGIIPAKAIFPWELQNFSDTDMQWAEIYHTPKKLWPVPDQPDLKWHVLFYYFPRDAETEGDNFSIPFKDITMSKKWVNPDTGKQIYVPWIVQTLRNQKFPREYPANSMVRIIDDNDDPNNLLLIRRGTNSKINKQGNKIKLYTDLIFGKDDFVKSNLDNKKKPLTPKTPGSFNCATEVKRLWKNRGMTSNEIRDELEQKCHMSKSRLQQNTDQLQEAIAEGIGKLKGVWGGFWGTNKAMARML
jgi:hypothetical protein